MANMNVTFLNQLNVDSKNVTIKVKIVKLWRRPMKDNKNETWSIEMILMDEQGTKVTASCLQKFFPRFKKHLIQDDCLFIHRPSLAENKFIFKFAEKEQKVTFFYNTLITKCDGWSGSEHGFVFADFNSILDKSGSNDNSIPLGSILGLYVIGYVVICYPMEPTTTKLGSGKRMTLKLRDLNNEDLTVTLWDEFAEEMNAYMLWKDKDMHHACGFTYSVWGKRIVSNAFDATRLFINNDIDDIKAFKKSYLENSSTGSSSTNHQLGSCIIKSVEDIFVDDTKFSPIAYVPLIDEEKSVVIVGTIKSICTEKLWYYNVCNVCKFKVQQKYITIEKEDGTCDVGDEKVFKCTNKSCNARDISLVYRFKILIRVQDSTGTVSLTLFDNDALKIIKKHANDLVERQEQSSEFEEYPAEFNDLIGKTFVFHIKISGYNINEKKEYYGIDKLTNDSDILSKLEKKRKNIDQHDETESIGGSMSEVQSNNTIGVKDMVSSTGDNTTPVSNAHEDFRKAIFF
ncbi:putative nucleic acid-binding, replication factor A [Helianthus debilis subsp. tardiflorus]